MLSTRFFNMVNIYIYTTYTTWKVDGNSHVLVYHGPLLIHLLGVASHAIYFHHGVYTYIYIYGTPPPRPIFSHNLLVFALFCCFLLCLNVFFFLASILYFQKVV